MTKEKTFQIESATKQRKYDSEQYGQAKLTIKVHDFYPCLDSWQYDPPEMYESLTGDMREMPAEFRGKDLLHCTITLIAEFGAVKRNKFVSLRRGVRRSTFHDGPATYETSAMVRDSKGVYVRPDDENRIDPHKGISKMIWELSSETPITLEDNLDMLIEEGHRLFEPDIPTHI